MVKLYPDAVIENLAKNFGLSSATTLPKSLELFESDPGTVVRHLPPYLLPDTILVHSLLFSLTDNESKAISLYHTHYSAGYSSAAEMAI
jgi:hypothetical protein